MLLRGRRRVRIDTASTHAPSLDELSAVGETDAEGLDGAQVSSCLVMSSLWALMATTGAVCGLTGLALGRVRACSVGEPAAAVELS